MTAIMDRQELKQGRADRRLFARGRRLGACVAAALRAFRNDARAAMAITMGFFMVLLMGMGVLALDVGRMVVLKTQLQHAADAAAFAAATQLIGADGSMVLANAVARNAAQQSTSFLESTTQFTIAADPVGIRFYQNWTPGDPGSGNLATADSNAVIVRVEMNSETLTLVLQPVLDILTGVVSSGTTVHSAYAVAQNASLACEMPPLMICNPFEDTSAPPCEGTPAANIYGPENIGKMVVIKEGPGGTGDAPGEFNLLCTADGACGANAIGDALADPSYSPDCLGPTVQTSPGSKTNKVVNGINVRFDQSPKSGPNNDPAPNIYDFGRDSNWASSDIVKNGQWNPKDYLSIAYPLVGHPFDPDPTVGRRGRTGYTDSQGNFHEVDYPTRYQVYLWEIGVPFQMNGPVTVYPVVPDSDLPDVPAGIAGLAGNSGWGTPSVINLGGSVVSHTGGVINPAPATNIQTPLATTPSTQTGDEEAWVQWRNLRSAVLDCTCLGVAGNGYWNSFGHYIDWFITEAVIDPGGGGGNAQVFAEYLGAPLAYFGNPQSTVKGVQLIE